MISRTSTPRGNNSIEKKKSLLEGKGKHPSLKPKASMLEVACKVRAQSSNSSGKRKGPIRSKMLAQGLIKLKIAMVSWVVEAKN